MLCMWGVCLRVRVPCSYPDALLAQLKEQIHDVTLPAFSHHHLLSFGLQFPHRFSLPP